MANDKVREDRDLEWKAHGPAITSLNDRVDNIVDLFIAASGKLEGVQTVYLAINGLYQKYSEYFGNESKIIKTMLAQIHVKLSRKDYVEGVVNLLSTEKNNKVLKSDIARYEQVQLTRLNKIFIAMNKHFVRSNLFPKPQITKHERQKAPDKGGLM